MNNYNKAMLGTVAAGAMAAGALATPVQAQSTEEIIAGAAVLAGVALILGRDRDDDYRYRDRRYGNRYGRDNARRAVDMCVRTAERAAQRAGYRFADVYEIYDVDDQRRGWKVKGRIAVESQRGGRYNSRYDDRRYRDRYDDRYDRRDRRYRDQRRVQDEGRFTCRVEYGRIRDLDFSGVRGLR